MVFNYKILHRIKTFIGVAITETLRANQHPSPPPTPWLLGLSFLIYEVNSAWISVYPIGHRV